MRIVQYGRVLWVRVRVDPFVEKVWRHKKSVSSYSRARACAISSPHTFSFLPCDLRIEEDQGKAKSRHYHLKHYHSIPYPERVATMNQLNPKTIIILMAISWNANSAVGFGFGDIHSHVTPFLNSPTRSLLQDSASNFISSTALITNVDPHNAAFGLFQKYQTTLNTHPLPTKMLTGAALATAGDAIAQGREDDDYNAKRGASFAAFDMTYRAAQHHLFPIIVELCRGQYFMGAMATIGASQFFDISSLAAMERSLASQLIIVPFMYYPVFFTFTGFMQGLTFEEGVERAKENFIPLMKRNLLFWIPVQYVQFCYVPTDLQIPFLSVAGLAWTFILSVMAGSAKKYSNDNPDHETYCVTGVEDLCVIPDDELFPVVFDDFDESYSSVNRNEDNVANEQEKELLMNK